MQDTASDAVSYTPPVPSDDSHLPPSKAQHTRLFFIFVPMAFIGTMLHEAGHIAVARLLGYSTTLHFGSMSWFVEGELPADYWNRTHDAWILIGGPATNMGLGLIGLFWLMKIAKRGPVELRGQGMLAILLTLLWSRQVFNAGLLAARAIGGADWTTSDEVLLAYHLEWSPASISLVSAAAAALVIVRAILLVNKPQRFHLIALGAAGSLAGYALWYLGLGPLLLP